MLKRYQWAIALLLASTLLLTGCGRDDEEEEEPEETEPVVEETEEPAEPIDLTDILVTTSDTPERHDADLHRANSGDDIYCYYCYITLEGGQVSEEVFETHRHDTGVDQDSCYICTAYGDAWETANYSTWHLAYMNQFDQVSTLTYAGTTYDSRSSLADGLIAVYLDDLNASGEDELLLVYLEDGELYLRVAEFDQEGVVQSETSHRVADTMYNGDGILTAPYEDLAVYVVDGGVEGKAVVVEYSFGYASPDEAETNTDDFAFQLASYQYADGEFSAINSYWNIHDSQEQVDLTTIYGDVSTDLDMTDCIFSRLYDTNRRDGTAMLATIRTVEDREAGPISAQDSESYPTQVTIFDKSDLYWIGDEIAAAASYTLKYADDEEDEEENDLDEVMAAIRQSAMSTLAGDPVPTEVQVTHVATVTMDDEDFYRFLVTFSWTFDTGTVTVDVCYWYYSVTGPTDWYEEIDGWQQTATEAILPYISVPADDDTGGDTGGEGTGEAE